jgi:hypothetical protein
VDGLAVRDGLVTLRATAGLYARAFEMWLAALMVAKGQVVPPLPRRFGEVRRPNWIATQRGPGNDFRLFRRGRFVLWTLLEKPVEFALDRLAGIGRNLLGRTQAILGHGLGGRLRRAALRRLLGSSSLQGS